MQYKYFPQTEEDIALMLDKIGVKSLDDLYAEVPECIEVQNKTTICLRQRAKSKSDNCLIN